MISDYEQNLLGNRENSKTTSLSHNTLPPNNNQQIKAKKSCFNRYNLKPEYKSNEKLKNILETFSKETTLTVKGIDTYFSIMLSKISNKKKYITPDNILEVIATIITKYNNNINIIY